jgi:hypothetical protein
VLTLFVAGCGHPTNEEVAADFLREHPTYRVIEVGPGEGDGSTVYMHIRFRRPGQVVDCEVEWGYQQAEPKWRIFHKSVPREAGTGCADCPPQQCT